MIDLHCHSHFSDGALSPLELVNNALKQGVQCLSLTDHDTVLGYPELYEAAHGKPIQVVFGIELSTRWKKYDIHILGYRMATLEQLNQIIEQQNQSRIIRAKQIGEALLKADMMGAYEKACSIAGHERVGRPHFARAIVNEGKAKDLKTAFKRYLIQGKVAYFPTPWVSIQEAVEVLVNSGGDAVLAHPHKYGLTRTKLHELINEFKEAGGVGMEVVSGDMTKGQVNDMAATSIKFKLLASTGSDYHGEVMSRVGLGRQQNLPENCMPIWQKWTI